LFLLGYIYREKPIDLNACVAIFCYSKDSSDGAQDKVDTGTGDPVQVRYIPYSFTVNFQQTVRVSFVYGQVISKIIMIIRLDITAYVTVT